MENKENNLYIANKYVKEIREYKGQIDDIYAISENEIKEIKEKANLKVDRIQAKIDYLKNELFVLTQTMDMKESKTQKKKVLLDGSIIIKKPVNKFCLDKKELAKWLSKNKPEFVEVKSEISPKWSEFKKHLTITEDREIVDKETGELINATGLGVVEEPSKIEFEF